MFKKIISSAIITSVIGLTIPLAAATAEAHPGCRAHRVRSRTTSRRTAHRRYAPARYESGYSDSYGNGYATSPTTYRAESRPGYYSRHRRLVNTGVGAVAGAIVGGLLGGRRGAGLGILAGGAGSQVFTHYQRPRNRTRIRY
ncbi:MAG: hypothetical protein ABIO36_08530 [Pyrinomonadaceae bacterium]